jgi:hypothetical protein
VLPHEVIGRSEDAATGGGEVSYDEIVTLLIPYEDPRTLTLADAVFMVLQTEDRLKRIGATIVRDSGEEIGHAQMVKIYDRADFPRRPMPRSVKLRVDDA